MASEPKCVELGFAEKIDSWKLRSKFFPSKLGGKPAWLALTDLPTVKCKCGEPMTFIMQVYAPLDDHPIAFHRTLFLFGCQPCVDKNKPKSLAVYRSQLPLVNKFYADTPSEEVEKGSESPSAHDFNELCCVCGCLSSAKCSLCKTRSYCSKQHQTMDWKKAHKFVCPGNAKSAELCNEAAETKHETDETEMIVEETNVSLSTLNIDAGDSCAVKSKKKKKEKHTKDYEHNGILKEFDIETETEELDNEETAKKEDTQEDLVKYLKKMDKSSLATMKEMASCTDKDLKEIEDMSKGLNDKAFKRFKKTIEPYSEQILRYCKGGQPLWVSADGLPKSIPKCAKCNGPREYEFQVMPHVLNLFKNDLLDWGTLAVYTCKSSCEIDGYVEEFVFRQDFT